MSLPPDSQVACFSGAFPQATITLGSAGCHTAWQSILIQEVGQRSSSQPERERTYRRLSINGNNTGPQPDDFASQGIFCNFWGHFWLSQLEGVSLLESGSLG